MNQEDLLHAEIANTTRTTQRGRLQLTSIGLDGRQVQREFGRFSLAPGETQQVSVEVSALPIQSPSASVMDLEVVIERDDGLISGSPSGPFYYTFDTDYTRATFYAVEDAELAPSNRANEDSLEVTGRIWTAEGKWEEVRQSSEATGLRQGITRVRYVLVGSEPAQEFALKSVAGGVASAGGLVTANVCSKFNVFFVDTGMGEDHLVGPPATWFTVPARYARASIRNSVGLTYWSGNLDGNGCTGPILLYPSLNTFVQWTSDLRKTSTNAIVHGLQRNGSGQDVAIQTWTSFTVPSTPPATITVNTAGGVGHATQAAAVAGVALWKHHSGVNLGIENANYTILGNVNCPGYTDPVSCSTGTTVYLTAGTLPARAFWKFVVAHEFGHAVQHVAVGSVSNNYNDADTANLCKCDHIGTGNQIHCLQSREFTYAAMQEGLAHAFATRAFNATAAPDAKFNYYKEFLRTDGGVDPAPSPRDGYNSQRWMELRCTSAPTGSGVEWDWLTFIYNIAAEVAPADQTTLTSFFDIMGLACNPGTGLCSGQTPAWTQIRGGAQALYGLADPRFQRFDNTGIAHGVDH